MRPRDLEAFRKRIAKRAAKGRRVIDKYARRDVPPLPLNERFWRDVELMHIRCEAIKKQSVQP